MIVQNQLKPDSHEKMAGRQFIQYSDIKFYALYDGTDERITTFAMVDTHENIQALTNAGFRKTTIGTHEPITPETQGFFHHSDEILVVTYPQQEEQQMALLSKILCNNQLPDDVLYDYSLYIWKWLYARIKEGYIVDKKECG